MPNRLVVGPHFFPFPDLDHGSYYHIATVACDVQDNANLLAQVRFFQENAGVTHVTLVNSLCPDALRGFGLEVETFFAKAIPFRPVTRISCSDYRLNPVLYGTRRNHIRMAGGLKRIAEEDSFVLSQIQTMRQMGVKEFEGGNHGGVCAGYAGDNPHYPTDPTREEEFHREQGEAAVRVLWKYFGVRLALGYYRPNERGFEFIPLA